MALFDPHRENARKAAAPGGIAPTASAALHETLPAALEPELRKVIDTAVARVAGIELDAIHQSRRLTQGAEYEGREALKQAQDRAFQLVNSIELLTVTISGMVDTLRVALDDSAEALGKVREPESELSRELDARSAAAQAGSPEPPRQAITEEPAPDEPAPEESAPVAASPDPAPAALNSGEQRMNGAAAEARSEPVSSVEPSPEMTEMFREQILNMKRSGKRREEAERSLLRFNFGRRFVGLLDEVYSEGEPEPPLPAANDRSKGAVRRFLSRS